MSSNANLDSFLETIMHISVLRMGGASAGITGSSGGDSELVNNLKRSAIAFAREYRQPTSRQDELTRLAQEINGYLQTLQLTCTLSASEVDKLTDELQVLAGEESPL
jgi:hypothetical protein